MVKVKRVTKCTCCGSGLYRTNKGQYFNHHFEPSNPDNWRSVVIGPVKHFKKNKSNPNGNVIIGNLCPRCEKYFSVSIIQYNTINNFTDMRDAFVNMKNEDNDEDKDD